MPRNDQIARQWHLLRRLEGSPGRTVNNLVENLPPVYPNSRSAIKFQSEPQFL
jgi:hypothetical protein